MKKIFIIFILSILFLSENIFAQQVPVKNDSSNSRIKKLQLSLAFSPTPLLVMRNVKVGVGLKINNHIRLNLVGAYGKMELGYFPAREQDNVSYKNRLKLEIQLQRKIDKYPFLFFAPCLSYYQATVISYHDTSSYSYEFRATENHSKILSPGGIVGVRDEENHFGIELYAGVGYKFQLGDYSGNYYDSFRTYQSGISLRAEASFYFNFYKGRKKKFNLLD